MIQNLENKMDLQINTKRLPKAKAILQPLMTWPGETSKFSSQTFLVSLNQVIQATEGL